MKHVVLATFAFVSLDTLAAQSAPLKPGDTILRASQIRTGTDSFRIESSFGGTERKSMMIRTISRAAEGGRALLVFAQRYNTPQGVTVDTTWVDAASLAPVRYFAEVYGEIQKFTFDARGGTGTVTPKDSATRTVNVDGAVPFFNAVAIDLLYASLPLAPGFTTEVPLYNPPRASFRVTLTVTGEEELELAAGGKVATWTVDYRLGPNAQKLWLDKRTGEFLRIGSARGADWFYKWRADLKRP